MLKSSVVYSVKGFGIKTPALFISTSIRPNRDTAVSTIVAAVPGWPMSPSTNATFAAAGNGFSLVMCREFATTLYPRFRNASTSPAPIPREAPVIIAVFVVFAICQIPFSVKSARTPHSTLEGCACKDFDFLHLRRNRKQLVGSRPQCLGNIATQVGIAARFICKGVEDPEPPRPELHPLPFQGPLFITRGWLRC